MKLKIKENSITRDELNTRLLEGFSNEYSFSYRGKYMIVIAKTKLIGCTVMVRKKSILINGNFSTMMAQIIFTILVVLLGVIVPLLVYFLVFHKKMKVIEKEVAYFIKENYKEEIIQ